MMHVTLGPFLTRMAVWSSKKFGCRKDGVACILHKCQNPTIVLLACYVCVTRMLLVCFKCIYCILHGCQEPEPYKCQTPSHRCQPLDNLILYPPPPPPSICATKTWCSRGINLNIFSGPASLSPNCSHFRFCWVGKKGKWHASTIIRGGQRSGLFLSSYPPEFFLSPTIPLSCRTRTTVIVARASVLGKWNLDTFTCVLKKV